MDCEYRIVSNPGFKVALHFVMVNLNRQSHSINMSLNVSNSENYDDSLTVYDVEPLNNTSTWIYIIIRYYSMILCFFITVEQWCMQDFILLVMERGGPGLITNRPASYTSYKKVEN